MNRHYLIPVTLSAAALLFTGCTSSSNSHSDTEVKKVDSTAMARPDDFDSTATEQKKMPEEELPVRYTANTSNEAIELMRQLPDADKYISGILPRMSQQSLSYAMKLLNSEHDGFLIVDKESMHVALYDRYGREKLRYGIACGSNYGTKHAKGDSRTPEGFFSVEGIYDSTDWLFRDDNGRVSKVKGQFGPRFIRLLIPGTTQIGIHGTRAPGSIGRRCSHGCIRVTNDNILELVKHVKPGMPVIVSPSRRDEKVNLREGRHIPWVTLSGTSRQPMTDIPDPVVRVNKSQKQDSVKSTEKLVPEPVSTETPETTSPVEIPAEPQASPTSVE